MKILFTADQHITLRKSKVPKAWALDRYKKYFTELNKIPHDIMILGGDFFDKKPNVEEIGVFLDLVAEHNKPIYMIAGNHEATTKYATFLTSLESIKNISNLHIILDDSFEYEVDSAHVIKFMTYHYIKAGANPPTVKPNCKNILITHARGQLAFTDPEYDFSRFSKYDLVLIGDLHTYHQEDKFPNVWYPGSPYSITFKKEQIPHGVFLVNTEDMIPEFIPLQLPQLIKIVVNAKDIYCIPEDDNCYITEVTGTAEELGKIERSDTVVRKLEVRNSATVALANLSPLEELRAVLDYMGIKNKKEIEEVFNEIT